MEGEDLIGVSVTALRRMKATPAAAEVVNFFVAAVNVIKVYPMHGSIVMVSWREEKERKLLKYANRCV